jgi:uncharacterized protein YndB with AHSA1/START domain
MINTLVFVTAFCLVAVLVYVAKYSGRVRVTQTRLVDAPRKAVYALVADFHHWQQWSPWLVHAPDALLTVSRPSDAPAGRCAWDIANVGEGEVEHVRLVTGERITQRMRLKHPFTVKGVSDWTFTERGTKTEVTWRLEGRVAFSLRAFANTVKGSLELDVRYGLDCLARLVEPADAPHYDLVYLGLRDIEAARFVFRTYQGPLKGLPAARRKILGELTQELQGRGVRASGAPLALYVKTNIKLRTTVCQMGIPVGAASVDSLPVREIAAHRAWVVRLSGSHTALDIAWYLAMQRAFLEGVQPDQRLAPFEAYLNESSSIAENDLVTELLVPIRERVTAI